MHPPSDRHQQFPSSSRGNETLTHRSGSDPQITPRLLPSNTMIWERRRPAGSAPPTFRTRWTAQRLPFALVIGIWTFLGPWSLVIGHSGEITHISTNNLEATLVPDLPIAYTAQILPLDPRGNLAAKGDALRQTEQVLRNLYTTLRAAGAGLETAVKLNIYVKDPQSLPKIQDALTRTFQPGRRPALGFITTTLSNPDALVAMDAVAAITNAPGDQSYSVRRLTTSTGTPAHQTSVAILPAGGRFYVSGQAKNGPLREATHNTLTNLDATLSFLGVGRSNVVQLKAFIQPISESPLVLSEIASFFAPNPPPPVVFVDWTSPANTPIEIELIASDGKPQESSGDSITFLTPPGLTVSKVFSRVAHVTRGSSIYIAGLYGPEGADGAGQVRDIFNKLKTILTQTGSDLEHLAKATYYVSDDDASNKLNDIRPEFFNPARPPAASKAIVRGVGLPARTITVDMIAVTK